MSEPEVLCGILEAISPSEKGPSDEEGVKIIWHFEFSTLDVKYCMGAFSTWDKANENAIKYLNRNFTPEEIDKMDWWIVGEVLDSPV